MKKRERKTTSRIGADRRGEASNERTSERNRKEECKNECKNVKMKGRGTALFKKDDNMQSNIDVGEALLKGKENEKKKNILRASIIYTSYY